MTVDMHDESSWCVSNHYNACPGGCGSTEVTQYLWTSCRLMFQAYIDVHANKRDSILFSYLHGEFQVSVARVQFVKKNNSFIEIRHNGQAVTHIALIEGGELAHFLLIFPLQST